MTDYIGEWTTVDKSAWGPGAWQDEPDKVHWIDPETDLDCLMVRHPSAGHWCGYVAVTEGHPFYEQDYDGPEVEVHGGLTFSRFCAEGDDPAQGICHVPQPGRPDKVWWLGFDCAHHMDLSPGSPYGRGRYRDRAYVENEVRRLAQQVNAVKP